MCRSLMRTCHCRWHLCLTVEGSGRYNCRSTRSTHLSLMMVPYLSNSIVLVLDTCHMLFSLFGKYLEKKRKNCGSSFHVSAWPAFRTSVRWSMGDLLEAGWLGESASGCPTSTSCTCVSPLVTPACTCVLLLTVSCHICPLIRHKTWFGQDFGQRLDDVTFVHTLMHHQHMCLRMTCVHFAKSMSTLMSFYMSKENSIF